MEVGRHDGHHEEVAVTDVDASPSERAAGGNVNAVHPWRRVVAFAASHTRVMTAILIVVLSTCYLTPRLLELDRLVTVDERFWLGRSANFYDAISHGDFADTYQQAHPGVPVMWAGTIGFAIAYPEYRSDHPGQMANEYHIGDVLRSLDRDPMDVLVAARVAKIALEAVVFAVGLWLAWSVFGRLVASVGALLIAFDPFLLAHDRLLHIDGMVAVTAFAALMALLRFVQKPHANRYLVLSAVFASMAWLTRIPAVMLAGIVVVTLVIITAREVSPEEVPSPARAALRILRPAAIWSACALIATIVLWPAIWADPGMVIDRMSTYLLDAAGNGHEAGIFYNGETVRGDPGLSYYPVAILWRTTPVVIAGLVVVLTALALRLRIVVPARFRLPLMVLGSFAVLYLAGMTVGAKKFDRYILPIFPALDLIAAIGIVGLGRLLFGDIGRVRRTLTISLATVAVGAQLVGALLTAPYYLQYFNPLVGGTASGEDMLLLGWGEGLDQVADYILSRPGGEHATVHMSNNYSSLGYLLPGTATVETHAYETDMESMVQWAEADYYVAYVTQWQRGYYSRPIDYLHQFQPVQAVELNGVEFARTYDLNAIPPPSDMTDRQTCSFTYGDQVELVGYRDERLMEPGDANLHTLSLYFVVGANPLAAYDVQVQLIPLSDGLDMISQTVTYQVDGTEGTVGEVEVPLELPGRRTTKSYVIVVTLVDPATGEEITPVQSVTGDPEDIAVMAGCE